MMNSNPLSNLRLPKTLRVALDALVVAGLLSSTANTIENQLDLMLVASRVVGHAANARGVQEKVRRGARNVLLTGELGLRTASLCGTSATMRRSHAIGQLPLTLSAH